MKGPYRSCARGWALVRVRLAGICNTDVEILRGYHDFRGTPGHEFVGEVAEVASVSSNERKKWMGRRVCGEINVTCSSYGFKPRCEFCKRGLKTHCARRTVLRIVAHDGAFAEYLALPLENLHAVPDSVSDEQAVFVEPLAAACEILEQVNAPAFRSAAVLGDGKLLQLIARVLRTRIPRVAMYGKHDKKLALGRRARIETKKVRGDAGDDREAPRTQRFAEGFRIPLEAVDAGSDAGGAETVVDVDDGDVGGAGVEHAEECGDAAKAGAVTDARRHSNDRRGDETADDTGKRAFHSGNANDDAGLCQLAFAMLEEAVNAGDADVVELVDAVAQHARGKQGFFGDGNIARACGDHQDPPLAGDFVAPLDGNDAGERMKFGGARGFAVGFFDRGEDFGVGAGDENVVVRSFLPKHRADDSGDLLRRLPFGKDDFGKALAQGAVMVHFGEAEIFEGQVLEPLEGRAGGKFAAAHRFQDFQ